VYLGQRLNAGVQGILVAMIFRMGLPLAAGVVITQQNEPLARAGLFAMILALYFVALVVETALSLKFVPRSFTKHGQTVQVAGGIQGR
jgi:hypothetical protein